MTEPTDVQKALAALQILVDLGLSAGRVKWLLSQPERTEAMVQEQLDKTDAAIQTARKND
jgi:hypothetical protein